ncbi:ABC transporter permease [Saccharothrix sp. S26]|uniref:ABC transporter permease n=1 Tax=Saccharothrix sp. S26 TaxID=2907215 RepID=UPI001F367C33|nr:ABC transporter permease [Saccharothrix sp. S26]MCE6993688.1 ABC transporter permease [Saccharothrix sp. S26]
MAALHDRPPAVIAVATAVVGAVIALVLGLVTFGVQATVHPDGVPLAVAVPADAPPQLRGVADKLAGGGATEVAWRVATPDQARDLLSRQEVYGVLELAPSGATVLLSGAVNPSGTQVAQQMLTGVAQGAGTQAKVVTLDPSSAAGRTAPLAASALLWIAGLVAGAALTVLARGATGTGRVAGALTTTVLGVAVVAGFFALWDSSLPLDAAVLGYLALVAAAFALVQGALLRLLGLRAMALLGPLYLIAPAVAGQVPELLDPVYRALLWSWTPFRFSTEGLRALLHGGSLQPAQLWVFVGLAAAGLVVLLLPGKEGQPDLADGVVDVGVDQAHRLPGAQRQHTA